MFYTTELDTSIGINFRAIQRGHQAMVLDPWAKSYVTITDRQRAGANLRMRPRNRPIRTGTQPKSTIVDGKATFQALSAIAPDLSG